MFNKIQKHNLKTEAKTIVVIMLMLLNTKLLAQKPANIKLFAYSREVSGGAMRATNGNPNGNKKTFYHYFIYLETKEGRAPVISSVFLNDDHYFTQIQKVQTPVVIFTTEDGETRLKHTLVKQTQNQVYQLIVTGNNANLPAAATLKKQADTNDVLIQGMLAGKDFTLTQTKFKKLPIVFAQ